MKKIQWLKVVLTGVLLFFTLLMAKIVIPYYSESWDYDFLVTKMSIIHLAHYRFAFLIHISSSLGVIFTGAFLFLSVSGRRYWKIHRWMGRLYVGLVLLLAAPSGLIMGYYANGGVFGQINFMLLSIFWWWFTFLGFDTIIKKKVVEHKKWMLRSYALTLSAVTLRFLQMIIPLSWSDNPMLIYVIVSWSSWILNLMLVEVYIKVSSIGMKVWMSKCSSRIDMVRKWVCMDRSARSSSN